MLGATPIFVNRPILAETLADRLTRFMRQAGLKNPDVAAAAHVDHTTVSKWRSGKQIPDVPKLKAVVELLGDRGVSTSVSELLGTSEDYPSAGRTQAARWLMEAGPEVEFANIPARQRARVWLEQFLLELAEEGADEDFMLFARRFLLQPSNYAMYAGGRPEEMSDDQKLRHMQGLAVGVRALLKDRLNKGGPDGKTRR